MFAGAPRRLSPCRFRPVGKGLERETLLPFPRLRRFGTHYETGSKFLLLFSIKSKNENFLFCQKSSKRANAHLHQAKSWRNCAQPVRSTATFPHKKRPFSGLFPSTILHRQVHIRNMLPHGGIRRLIISALNRFDNLPMQLNRHINDSGVLRQRFTHCQTNPVFKGIL